MAKLQKQLGLLDVFSVAAGAMISSGLFVLPAIAFAKAGPAIILSYLFASILVLPTVLSKAELSTAMPRAGGTYFFVGTFHWFRRLVLTGPEKRLRYRRNGCLY